MPKVVVIDSDTAVSQHIDRLFGNTFTVIPYTRAALASDFVRDQNPDVVVLSLDLSTIDPLELVDLLSVGSTSAPIVAMSANPVADLVVAAMHRGACDVIRSPCPDRELRRAVMRALVRTVGPIWPNLPYPVPSIVGMSPVITRLRSDIQRIAGASAPVVVTGESGVGKELVATALHELSPRVHCRLVARNCGAIPDALFEAEMFGTERGAFTDARSRPGAFELADGGTLFLDEIGELSLASQVKLLRAIESGVFYRVGGVSPQRSSARLVVATNRDLSKEVARRAFRSDLYYRINVVPLNVPPLRDRSEDIPLLVRHFQLLLARTERLSVMPTFSHDAITRLSSCEWPGNTRELKNVVWRSMLFASGPRITAADLRFDDRLGGIEPAPELHAADPVSTAVSPRR